MHASYTSAVMNLINDGHSPKAVFAGLSRVLEARGHERLLPRITRMVLREVSRRSDGSKSQVVVASPAVAESALVTRLCKELKIVDEPCVVIDDTVIGGALVRANLTQIDATYKTALIALYQNITK